MQCAEDDFKITPKNYSLYLDPRQREKELKITWVKSQGFENILEIDTFRTLMLLQKKNVSDGWQTTMNILIIEQ